MNLKERHRKLHDLWKQDFFEKFDAETLAATLGSVGRVSVAYEKEARSEAKKLDRKLVRLFRELGLDAQSHDHLTKETFGDFSEGQPTPHSTINGQVLETLIKAHQINKRAIEDLDGRIEYAAFLNKRGPVRAMQPYLAKLILIGFEAQRGSKEGLRLMLEFLDGEEFRRWLVNQRIAASVIEALTRARGDKRESVLSRTDKIKNYLTKAAVSSRHRPVVKRLGDNNTKPIVAALRQQVTADAKRLIAKL